MKKDLVKKFLFTIVGLVGLSELTNANLVPGKLKLIDQLPMEQRVVVYQKIMEYLIQNPQAAKESNTVIAIDQKGDVYVVEKVADMSSGGGAPSCTGGLHS